MTRSFFHAWSFRRIHLFVFRYRLASRKKWLCGPIKFLRRSRNMSPVAAPSLINAVSNVWSGHN